MSEVKKPAAKKSTGKGRTKPKKGGAKKLAQKQSVKSNPVDQALTLVAKKFVKAGGTKLLLKVFPYLLFGYFGNKMAYAYRVTEAPDFFNKLMGSLSNLGPAFENIWPSINLMDLLFGAVFGVGMRLVVYFKSKNAKKFRKGEEYGSARWGNAKDIEPYMDLSDPENNVILTQTEGLIMNGKPKGPKYARNKNILVIGGSGSGKTRFFVKPNIMQLHSSYVITDPKGTVLLEVGQMLYDAGYEIKVLNTINFKKSMHYNPFAYLHDEKDILKLVNTLIVNTKGEGQQATEDFWVKAEKLLYQAYIGYIYYECVQEEQNFITLIDMINASETREDDENFKNAIDLIFEELEADEPDHFAVKQYKKYKLAAG
ncbi:MAG: type IV secretory system conjugative DNA transfer family protein, partial [Lachnospiraceae bacterium]|nr:type IV secretory system conjugative DNA transfer family protein [Lachnospiraceae bacterium]